MESRPRKDINYNKLNFEITKEPSPKAVDDQEVFNEDGSMKKPFVPVTHVDQEWDGDTPKKVPII